MCKIRQKTESKFDRKITIKKAGMCFCWELNWRTFLMAEVKIEKKLQKKGNLFSLGVKLETFYNGRGG